MAGEGISRERIAAAHNRIRNHIRRTPVTDVAGADLGIEHPSIKLKLELLQHAGSFKARGAFANLLLRDVPPAGVTAASGGNHGAAVALAAARLGAKAAIFVPEISSPAKIEAIRRQGADLHVGGARYVEALAACEAYTARTGAMAVHAYDQIETLLGQGTVGLELEAQEPGLDTLLVAVGGGGLIGGIAAWYGGRIKVLGVEPATSCALDAALAAGRPVDVEVSGIATDSLGATRIGSLAFQIARDLVEEVFLVSDDAIREAQRRLWQSLRVVAEPGGAAALAALTSGVYRPARGERVGVLVCGGNTTAVSL
jgi:threonine dehydratase